MMAERSLPHLLQQGQAHFMRGEYDAAAVRYQEAVDLAPDAYPARYNLALARYMSGRLDEAAAQVESHIARFWEKRMRNQIIDHLRIGMVRKRSPQLAVVEPLFRYPREDSGLLHLTEPGTRRTVLRRVGGTGAVVVVAQLCSRIGVAQDLSQQLSVSR